MRPACGLLRFYPYLSVQILYRGHPIDDLAKMAGTWRITRALFARKQLLSASNIISKNVRCCSVVAGSTQHTLSVKKRIDKTREAALLGGGQKRIDKQHKKVWVIFIQLVRVTPVMCVLKDRAGAT